MMRTTILRCVFFWAALIHCGRHADAEQLAPSAGAVRESTPAARSTADARDGRHDFDFIEGRWKVDNHQLRNSGGSDGWNHFELDYEGWSMMGALANVDRIYGQRAGKYFEGVSVRTFDPATRDWTIYWMDINHPHLTEEVRGHFEGDAGTFLSTNKATRFIWRREMPDKAHWRQELLLPQGRWETNWKMDFRHVGGHDDESSVTEPAAPAQPAPVIHDGRHDFDFIAGRWKALSRQRHKSGSDDWNVAEMSYQGWTAMGGLSNFDRMFGSDRGKYFEGVSVRTFDPVRKEWTIYWTDIDDPQLKEQVHGKFDGDVGTFLTNDKKVRFIWHRRAADQAHWELERLLPNGQWEVSWTIEFRRAGRT
jgi:hypothetical protein